MKKILVFLGILISLKSVAQYPVNQSLGSDSTLVTSKGGLKSRIVNTPFTDTAQANLQRIRQYPGAQIFTTSDNLFWLRNSGATGWINAGGGGGGAFYDSVLMASTKRLSDTAAAIRNDFPAGGGGAAGDSSFNTLDVGIAPVLVGTLLDESFAGVSIPSGWTKGTQLTATYSNKAIVTGQLNWFGPAQSSNTTAWGNSLQFNTKHMPYEKIDFSMTIVPQTKVAGNIIAVTRGSMASTGLIIGNRPTIAWDLSNSYTSGRVKTGFDSVSNFLSLSDSTSRAQFSVGDTLVLYFHRDGWGVTAGIINKATGITTVTKTTGLYGSGGLWNFAFLSSSQAAPMAHIINIKVSSFDRKGGVWFFGDSHTFGSAATQEVRRFANQIFGSNTKYYGVWGLPSLMGRVAVTSGLVTELINDVQPSKVIEAFGYNDESDPRGAPEWSQTLDSIVYPLQRAGITTYVMGIVPRSSATDIYNDTTALVAARRGATFFDVRTPLLNGTSALYGPYNGDGTHLSNDGNTVVTNVILAKAGQELLSAMGSDSIPVMKINNLPAAQTEEVNRIVGIKGNNELVIIPNYATKAGTGISNVYTTNTGFPKTLAQPLSAIHTSGEIVTSSYFQNYNNGVGLRIGFHDDVSNASTTNSNIEISNKGTAGTGIGQVFRPWTPAGKNISIGAQNKPGTFGTLTSAAINNVGIGYGNLAFLTSGASNTVINDFGNSLTSGSSNIIIGGTGGAGPTTTSNSVMIGNNGGGGWGNFGDRIFIGQAVGGDYTGANSAVIAPGGNVSQRLWIGGALRNVNGGSETIKVPDATTGNAAFALNLEGGQPFSGSFLPGPINLRTTTTGAFSTYVNRLTIAQNQINLNGVTKMGSTTAPAATAVLDIESTTQGVLFPRMTTAQRTAITLDATNDGLMVYDVTLHKLYLNENGAWVQK